MEFQDKTALITGGTAGIGQQTAILLARGGASVIVTGRDAERGAGAVATIAAAGGSARYIPADLGDLASVQQLAAQAGSVDILVNNAGSFPTAATVDQDVASFQEIFDTNVRGAFFLTAALVPDMLAKGSGSIVNVTTMAAEIGMAGAAVYSASKAALASLTRTWAAEFSGSGVRVNSVSPGPTATIGVMAVWGEDAINGLGAGLPIGRPGTADEIAEAIVFLASDRASFVTGATIHADGGRTAI
ncbi:SDR family NAD(P)-dependent oxidoreductase [Conexibacter sp. CPCC 206217]|uniref:SDR family NAD(P)-dependent oxidoreductase n=1 Tax=Conexibacter sp. CPCC 206217 TaxID=3064574 RepID=UPI0027225860|nr:SDR family oxidoreductase [Conexibacter sp. CPCC 206217]MDO8212630.1 SDR family oxidoreductase [Conexibacter sp. CPCC 206217]